MTHRRSPLVKRSCSCPSSHIVLGSIRRAGTFSVWRAASCSPSVRTATGLQSTALKSIGACSGHVTSSTSFWAWNVRSVYSMSAACGSNHQSLSVGRPWMIRRSDSNAKLVSETEVRSPPFFQKLILSMQSQVEEFEHISMMFPSETAPAAGRVLSTFNAQCRLAVLYEKVCALRDPLKIFRLNTSVQVMDCRQTFASSEARAAAISTINRICERWREMLPAHLQIGPQVCQQPVVSVLNRRFWCISDLKLARRWSMRFTPCTSGAFPPPRVRSQT